MGAKATLVRRSRRRLKRKPSPRYSPAAYVRKYFPDAEEGLVQHIISGLTGWPGFWSIPEDGKTPYQCFTRQVRRVAAKLRNGVSINRQTFEAWDKPYYTSQRDALAQMEKKLLAGDPYDYDGGSALWVALREEGVNTSESRDAVLKEVRSRREFAESILAKGEE